jgi:hypothetical protein
MASVLDEALLSRVRAGMRGLKAPGHYDKVFKDECMFSFDTPESPGGLYVNLATFQARRPFWFRLLLAPSRRAAADRRSGPPRPPRCVARCLHHPRRARARPPLIGRGRER